MKYHQKLKELADAPRDGASLASIKELESSLQVKLPSELAALYAGHDGAGGKGKLPWRLLSLEEAKRSNQQMLQEKILPQEIRLFWTDDEGNFAGVYFGGPLSGGVCFFEREERDFSPRFKSLARFFQAMVAAAATAKGWREMEGEVSVAPESSSALEKLLTQFRPETDARKRRQLAFDVIRLMPLEQTSELMAFLNDEDLWVQERAAETLGKRRYEPAIAELVKVAQRETSRVHNARIGAILALGRMQSAASLEVLLRLPFEIPAEFKNYIIKALELHGCAVKFDQGKWRYRLPGAQEWNEV